MGDSWYKTLFGFNGKLKGFIVTATSALSEDLKTLEVFDLNMACAYYACVFDAVFDDLSNVDMRSMTIGQATFRMVRNRKGAAGEGLVARVEDVDVCVARAAAKGGAILTPAGDQPAGRVGVVKDPFGHAWEVRGL